jgi:hypothetical protein
VTAAEWFAELRTLMSVAGQVGPLPMFTDHLQVPQDVLDDWNAAHIAAGVYGRQWRTHPSTAELAATLLAVTHPILSAGSEAEFTAAARPVLKALSDQLTPRSVRRLPATLSPFVQRALWTTTARAGVKKTAVMLRGEPSLIRRGMQTRHIPVFPDPADVVELISPCLEAVGSWRASAGSVTQRRLTALCLAMLLNEKTSFLAAAQLLGLESSRYMRNPGANWKVKDKLKFRQALVILAERLIDRGLIDYQARRTALGDLTRIPDADWSSMAARYRPDQHRRTPYYAAIWLWVELAGGDLADAPAAEALRRGSRDSPTYTRWVRRMSPELTNRLRGWGMAYLAERGVQ